ncbi:CDP-diacylglycerol--glycerol-3-phosphate 3-phosphatidyltransferase [Gemmatimonadota bacterium]
MIWTIPNALSGFRLLLVPVFLWLMTRGTTVGAVLGVTTFAVAGITDTLDGYIARKYGSDSDLGRFLDPLADKILVLSAFYWAAIGNGTSLVWFNIWFVHIIAFREIVITTLRMVRRAQGRQVVTANEGKAKATLQMVTLSMMLTFEAASRLLAEFGIPPDWINSHIVWLVIQVLFTAALILTVISGIRYFTVNMATLPLSGSGEGETE